MNTGSSVDLLSCYFSVICTLGIDIDESGNLNPEGSAQPLNGNFPGNASSLMFAPYNGYLRFSTTAVFLYDWALTAEDEVETIWKQNMSITKVFFVILRYGTLALKSMDLWTATTSGISDEVGRDLARSIRSH